MTFFPRPLRHLILVIILAHLHEHKHASLCVSAATKEYKWVKSSTIEAIENYDPTSVSVTQSGFATAMNQKGDIIAIASNTELLQQGLVTGGVVNVYKQQNYTVGESNAEKKWEPLGAEIIVPSDGNWTGNNVMSFNEDGTIIAIGSRTVKFNMGHAMVLKLDLDKNIWALVGNEVTLSGHQTGEDFGACVGLSADGSTIAVGSPFYTKILNTELMFEKIGKVSIFNYNVTLDKWIPTNTSFIGEASNDEFGTSVALSAQGDMLAVGAPLNDRDESSIFGGRRPNAGHVRIFKKEANTGDWIQLGPDIEGEKFSDHFGSSVAMSYDVISPEDHRIAVGAPLNDGVNWDEFSPLGKQGHVRVFGFDQSTANWEKLFYDIDGEEQLDNSGYSVALDRTGTRLIVGGVLNDGDDEGKVDVGHARVFEVGYRGWTQVGGDLDGEGSFDHFGASVQINGLGNRVIAGAPFAKYPGYQEGAVYVYDWTEVTVEEPIDETSGSNYRRVLNSVHVGLLAVIYLLF